jgi:amino acid permease
MKKSLALGLGTCLLLFLICGVLGYLAVGDAVSGSLLLAFQGVAPAWVIVLGSLMVVLNMVPAYQVRPRSVLCVASGVSLCRSTASWTSRLTLSWIQL